jgi:hypothetical protein
MAPSQPTRPASPSASGTQCIMIPAQHCRTPALPGDNNGHGTDDRFIAFSCQPCPVTTRMSLERAKLAEIIQIESNHLGTLFETGDRTRVSTPRSFRSFFSMTTVDRTRCKRRGRVLDCWLQTLCKIILLLPCYAHRETVLVRKEVLPVVLRRARHASLLTPNGPGCHGLALGSSSSSSSRALVTSTPLPLQLVHITPPAATSCPSYLSTSLTKA